MTRQGYWTREAGLLSRPGSRGRRIALVVAVIWLLYGTFFAAVAAATQRGWVELALVFPLHVAASICCLMAFRRDTPERCAGWLALATALGLTLHAVYPFSGTAVIYVIPWLAPFRTRLWQAIGLGLADFLGFVLLSLYLGLPGGAIGGISGGLIFALFFMVVFRQLVAAKQQAEEVARAGAREAILAERTRLAREVHDVLAHSLSAQIVHLEGARLLLERGTDPAAALDRVTRAGGLARAGLEETRRALDTLRGEDLALADRLERLATEFRSATGSPCRVAVDEDPGGLAPEARLAIARTAQEALTNVRKHAPGAEVTLALRRRGRWCELDVRDSGGPPGEFADLGGGYGLVGMRERAELLGGTLDAGRDGTGFHVLLRVPA